MSSWRELFGFQLDNQPSYDLVHERWRERAKAQKADQPKINELGVALGLARTELRISDDDTVHPEQLLTVADRN
ncbi:MAG: hypothetical protein Q7T86_16680 [Hyphomicrobiaceae bacterium]|nr:hypothetical protein [Hyphomicrobiaceae bacterium]